MTITYSCLMSSKCRKPPSAFSPTALCKEQRKIISHPVNHSRMQDPLRQSSGIEKYGTKVHEDDNDQQSTVAERSKQIVVYTYGAVVGFHVHSMSLFIRKEWNTACPKLELFLILSELFLIRFQTELPICISF